MIRTFDLRQLLELTARLYDTAEEPARWHDVLIGLIEVFAADGAELSQSDSSQPSFSVGTADGRADGFLVAEFGADAEGTTRIAAMRSRDAQPFSDDERDIFSLLVPHMKRALNFRRQLAAKDCSGPVFTLSPRQREILTFGAQGLRSKEIAARLELSVRTVEHHFTAAATRLNARGRSQAIATALDMGLIEP